MRLHWQTTNRCDGPVAPSQLRLEGWARDPLPAGKLVGTTGASFAWVPLFETRMSRTAARCIFCDLIQGAAEVSVCYEDSDAIAFMDVQPVNGGHVLVVPRDHYESMCDVPPKVAMHLFDVSMRLAPIIRDVSGCGDMNLVVNSGEAAGQNVFHYHVHLIPRRNDDGFDIPLPFPGSQMPDRTFLDAMAARIIAALRDPARRLGKLAAAS
jgi:histidine triad (HIT) family protein